MNQSFSFEFEHKRHWDCGRLYYVEKNGPSSQCPYCAEKAAYVHREERTKDYATKEHLRRVISALRGALTKAKR